MCLIDCLIHSPPVVFLVLSNFIFCYKKLLLYKITMFFWTNSLNIIGNQMISISFLLFQTRASYSMGFFAVKFSHHEHYPNYLHFILFETVLSYRKIKILSQSWKSHTRKDIAEKLWISSWMSQIFNWKYLFI